MQEVIKNIINKLEKRAEEHDFEGNRFAERKYWEDYCAEKNEMKGLNEAIEIVKQTAEKYNNGWIPCSSGKLPDEGDEFYPICFVTLDNGAVCLGVYRYDDKQWYTKMIKDETLYTTKRNVIAWQPLPDSYQPKGE